jgi:four helix bundle protein
MPEPIEQLRIYKLARAYEDNIYELVKTLPVEEFYGVGNDLRQSSAAVSHHIMEAHRFYGYRVKISCLHEMQVEAQHTQKLLGDVEKILKQDLSELSSQYAGLVEQAQGLIPWLKGRLEAKLAQGLHDELSEEDYLPA